MANKYTFNMVVAEFIKFAKLNIADLAQKELDNKEKKEKLDKAIRGWLIPLIETVTFKVPFVPDFIVKYVFNKFILDNIPVLTQAVYDLLKDKVKGVTK